MSFRSLLRKGFPSLLILLLGILPVSTASADTGSFDPYSQSSVMDFNAVTNNYTEGRDYPNPGLTAFYGTFVIHAPGADENVGLTLNVDVWNPDAMDRETQSIEITKEYTYIHRSVYITGISLTSHADDYRTADCTFFDGELSGNYWVASTPEGGIIQSGQTITYLDTDSSQTTGTSPTGATYAQSQGVLDYVHGTSAKAIAAPTTAAPAPVSSAHVDGPVPASSPSVTPTASQAPSASASPSATSASPSAAPTEREDGPTISLPVFLVAIVALGGIAAIAITLAIRNTKANKSSKTTPQPEDVSNEGTKSE